MSPMADPPEDNAPIDPKEFDRLMNAKVLKYGSRQDQPCPKCGELGYRRVADSEMVALYACRHCGYQQEVLHELQTEVNQPFREYREGRGLQATVDDENAESGSRGP
jgi:DNA-directed RNA polymerase subunit M/transcription elongation factor TFIIS